jgi:hypothetical protein
MRFRTVPLFENRRIISTGSSSLSIGYRDDATAPILFLIPVQNQTDDALEYGRVSGPSN